MRVVVWILQVLLAGMFLWHGLLFVAPPAEVAAMMDGSIPPGFRVFIGLAELLAAVGLIVPSATRILPWLTPLAAAGLMIVMGSASIFHLVRGEIGNAFFSAVFFLLVTFVAYMRWKVIPIAPRKSSALASA